MLDIEHLYSKYLLSNGVSIDTRSINDGDIFFAIHGPNFNANEFANEAMAKGATFAVVDDEKFVQDNRFIRVDNGLQALQDLARLHRSKFERPVLGITGSNGKTTTKELIAKVLAEKFQVHATKGNFNNHIGVPLTLLGIKPQTEIAIVEMGASHVGEIASYCEIARPTHGLITNIGRAHTETFGGIEGVIRGKSELFDFIKKTDGVTFINNEDPVLSNMGKRFTQPIYYPSGDLKLVETTPYLHIQLSNLKKETKLIGRYNYINIAAAVVLGKYFDIDEDKILNAVGSYQPDNSRSEIIKVGSTTIILDAYNANPDSMKVALENLAEQKGKKVAILGDMNELENPDKDHLEILNLANALEIETLLTLGDKIGKVADMDNHFQSKEELEKRLEAMDLTDTTVLLKASRSIKLETIVKNIG